VKNFLGYRTVGKGPLRPSLNAVDDGIQSASHSCKASAKARSSNSKSTYGIVGPEKDSNAARTALLNSLVDQLARPSGLLKIPHGTHPEILSEIEVAGGLDHWLTMQPYYEALKKRRYGSATGRANEKKLLKETLSQNGERTAERASIKRKQDVRKLAQQTVIDAIIQRREISDFSIPIELSEEILASGGPYEWVRSQPDYILMLQERYKTMKKNSSNLRPSTFNATDLPREDSSKFTTKRFRARGKSRVLIPETYRPPARIKELYLILGTLPPSPRAEPGNHVVVRKQRLRICAAWVRFMDRLQEKAWKQLSREWQQEYLVSGRITVGEPTKAERNTSDATAPLGLHKPSNIMEVSLILDRVKRQSDDQWDVKKIDWGST
jgi:hypothetical protein